MWNWPLLFSTIYLTSSVLLSMLTSWSRSRPTEQGAFSAHFFGKENQIYVNKWISFSITPIVWMSVAKINKIQQCNFKGSEQWILQFSCIYTAIDSAREFRSLSNELLVKARSCFLQLASKYVHQSNSLLRWHHTCYWNYSKNSNEKSYQIKRIFHDVYVL